MWWRSAGLNLISPAHISSEAFRRTRKASLYLKPAGLVETGRKELKCDEYVEVYGWALLAMFLLISVIELQQLVDELSREAGGLVFAAKQFYFILQFFLEMPWQSREADYI